MRNLIMIVESSFGLPTRTFKTLWHVGNMDPRKKGNDSHEGAGLSVSLNPHEWRRIARGQVSGDLWTLTKSGNKFIDAHEISADQKSAIGDWAVEHGLATRQTTYRVSWFDDELESDVSQDFTDRAEAEAEADMMDTEVEEVNGSLVATDALRYRVHNRADQALVFDLILTVYAEENGFDGVWWDDELDVSRWSAPRGVIVPSKVGTWQHDRAK